ncbi:MAG: hypothetical protein Tsb0020_27920 [Haliangiales bacterium]
MRRPASARGRLADLSLTALVLLLIATLVPGCLGSTYTIPKQDLQDLAHTDPNSRGQRVRVIQNYAGGDAPPEAPTVGVHTQVVVVPSSPGYSGGGGGHVRTGKGGGGGNAKIAGDEAIVLVVLAAALVLGLAVTEGMRFDGWSELHPMHPVHLYGPRGEYTWLPLAHITPADAAWASRAVVRESEGPWNPIERAPLNRQGLTYAVLLGSTEIILADDQETTGFMSHIQLGGFFTPQLGLVLDIGFAFGEDDIGNALFDSRNALELEYFPVILGPLHAGVFGQVGFSQRLDDSPIGNDSFSFSGGAGGLLQLDLTTRLALTARAGVTQLHGGTTSDLTVGLSIY